MAASIASTLGVGSGIDIKSRVDSLTAADRAPKDAAIKQREDANTAKISSLAEIANGIDTFASALTGLIGGGSLFSQPSVSDSSILSATTVAGTQLGNLSGQIEVVQRAKLQSLLSASVDPTAAVGQGDLTRAT